MGEADLLAQLALCKRLVTALPYSGHVTVTPMEPAEIIAYGEKMGMLTRRKHPLGDVIGLQADTAELQAYFRNNVLHLFAASAWIALCFQNNRRLSRAGLLRLGATIYPFIQDELFLPWTEAEFMDRLNATMDLFIAEGLLHRVNDEDGGILSRGPGQTDEVFRLRAIAHSLQQAFERYFIAITTLVKNGPRTLSAGELETLCHLAAQRLSLLYAPAAPEFFDKTLFRGFIGKLRELKLVWLCPDGKLDFDERLNAWEKDAKLVLSRELRHTISKISPDKLQK
jgi:glycerol-3-phosphate O-acyltransferase